MSPTTRGKRSTASSTAVDGKDESPDLKKPCTDKAKALKTDGATSVTPIQEDKVKLGLKPTMEEPTKSKGPNPPTFLKTSDHKEPQDEDVEPERLFNEKETDDEEQEEPEETSPEQEENEFTDDEADEEYQPIKFTRKKADLDIPKWTQVTYPVPLDPLNNPLGLLVIDDKTELTCNAFLAYDDETKAVFFV